MGGRARHGRPKGNGSSVILKYMAGGTVDRRLRPVQEVDRWADELAEELGAKHWRELAASQRMGCFMAAGMFVLAAALLAAYLREGDVALYERYATAVGNVRRLLALLGLDKGEAADTAGELERALRQTAHNSHTISPRGDGNTENGER